MQIKRDASRSLILSAKQTVVSKQYPEVSLCRSDRLPHRNRGPQGFNSQRQQPQPTTNTPTLLARPQTPMLLAAQTGSFFSNPDTLPTPEFRMAVSPPPAAPRCCSPGPGPPATPPRSPPPRSRCRSTHFHPPPRHGSPPGFCAWHVTPPPGSVLADPPLAGGAPLGRLNRTLNEGKSARFERAGRVWKSRNLLAKR